MSAVRPTRSSSARQVPVPRETVRTDASRRRAETTVPVPPTAIHPSIRRIFAMTGQGLVRLAVIVAAVAGGVAWYLANRADPSVLFAKAEANLQKGHWEAARAQMRRLEGIRRPTPNDRALRARIEVGAGDDGRALEEIRQIVDDPELAPQALYMTGLIERRRQRLRYAEAAYRKAIRREPGLIPARKELIYILGMQSRRRELDAEFKDLARFAPLTHYDLYIWCLTHFVNCGPDSAEDLQPFLSADPEDRRTRVAIATLLLGQPGQEGRVDEVLKPLPPDDPDVLALR